MCLVSLAWPTHAFVFLSVESEGAVEGVTKCQRKRGRGSRLGDGQGPAPEYFGQWSDFYFGL